MLRKRQTLEAEMQIIQSQQHVLGKQQNLLIEEHCI